MMIKHKLSDKYSIWIGRYTRKYDQKDFLNAVKLNESLSIPNNNNSIWVEINNRAFNSVNDQVKRFLESNVNRKFDNYAEHYWVYTQQENYNQDWMHQHLNVHPSSRSKIQTDYSFTFYIKQLDNLKGNEGSIIFRTEDDKEHIFKPKTLDLFIFPGDLWHKAVPTPNHKEKRIVYAGSLAFDVLNPPSRKKNVF